MPNTENKQDAATLALWSAAEAGDFGEVEAVLASVADVDARNEHGVTALMRAAQRGHARVVRLLLMHGADANIIRHDKFTALSLAAFFGYTDVVRVLMEHGADLKASTRNDTSPHMWATARTFNEVVDQLKHPAPPRDDERSVPAVERFAPATTPIATPVPPGRVTSAIVRTLKDPPEIWDLVHEEPTGFNASSTFMDHLHSMRRGLLFRLATVAVLICAGAVGVLVLRGAQARSEAKVEQQASTPAVKLQTENKAVEERSVPAVVEVPSAAPSTLVEPPVSSPQRRRSHSWVPATRPVRSESAQRIENPTEKPDAPNKKPNVEAQAGSRANADSSTKSASGSKSSSPLSPHLISPAKNVSPKSKVIQWP